MEKIIVFANGKADQIPAETSISGLVAYYKLIPSMVMAEVNGTVILRKDWDSTRLQHGDRVELIRVVAGG